MGCWCSRSGGCRSSLKLLDNDDDGHHHQHFSLPFPNIGQGTPGIPRSKPIQLQFSLSTRDNDDDDDDDDAGDCAVTYLDGSPYAGGFGIQQRGSSSSSIQMVLQDGHKTPVAILAQDDDNDDDGFIIYGTRPFRPGQLPTTTKPEGKDDDDDDDDDEKETRLLLYPWAKMGSRGVRRNSSSLSSLSSTSNTRRCCCCLMMRTPYNDFSAVHFVAIPVGGLLLRRKTSLIQYGGRNVGLMRLSPQRNKGARRMVAYTTTTTTTTIAPGIDPCLMLCFAAAMNAHHHHLERKKNKNKTASWSFFAKR